MKKTKRFKKAFGLNDFEMIDFPKKISGIKISRIEIRKELGCDWCFPHGYHMVNATIPERNWKSHRKTQWKQKS